jgi:hypothetical protein
MTKPTNAENKKLKSRGWSDSMDSASISRRLAVVDELYACWKTLKKAKPSVRLELHSVALSAEKMPSDSQLN